MRLTMKERKTVTKALAEQYRRADKKKKERILKQFMEATGYTRHHAAWLFRNYGRRVQVAPGVFVQGDAHRRSRRARQRKYGDEVLRALKKL